MCLFVYRSLTAKDSVVAREEFTKGDGISAGARPNRVFTAIDLAWRSKYHPRNSRQKFERVRYAMMKRVCWIPVIGALAILSVAEFVRAQQTPISPDVYNEMKFRYIGPVGNRATAVAGIPGNAGVYYVGAASGGIFKSTDGGIHWDPIF